MFIDCTAIKGETTVKSCTIQMLDPTGQKFIPFDLSDYSIKFKILGGATANATVLVEHLITPSSELDVDGEITDPENGEFSFCISAEDTLKLGLGKFPIMLQIVDQETEELVQTITQGGKNGEFNKVQIIQV